MKKAEILKEVAQGNVVVNEGTLYRDNQIFRKVDTNHMVYELLDDYKKNKEAFKDVDKYIIYDLYNCFISQDDFEEYKELDIDFIRPDGDYSDVETYLLHDGVWYKKVR